MRRFARAVMSLALVWCAMAVPRASAAPVVMSLPDCAGAPKVRPAQVVFACGDGNFYAEKLQWTGWGDTFAAAVGTGEVNDCTPYCAAGKFHRYRIVVIASGRQTCPDGRPAYAKATYAWIGTSPFPKSAPDPATPFPCKPRR